MLRVLFGWLDEHPGSYWILAGSSTVLLFIQLGLVYRDEQRSPTVRPSVAVWRDALVLFIFLLGWRWPFLLSSAEFNPDESQLVGGAITLTRDPVFWRSVDGTTSGPLNFYVLLPWHWVGLPLDYFTARLTALLLIGGALFLLLRALAAHFGRTLAWMALLPAAGFFATATCNDLIHYSSEYVTLFLIAVSIWLLAAREKGESLRLWIGCFAAGSAIWAKLQAAPLSAVLLAWAVWQVVTQARSAKKNPWPQIGVVGLAATAPSLLASALILVTGQAGSAYHRYIVSNLFYVGKARPVRDALREMTALAVVDGRVPWFLATAAAVLVVTTNYSWRRRSRPSITFVMGALTTAAAVIAIVIPRREFLHYTLLLIIPLSLWIGGALGDWWHDLSTSHQRRRFIGFVILFTGLPLLITRGFQPVPIIYGDFSYHWRHPRGTVAEVVHALAGKHGSLGIWGWASYLYVETGLPQATRDAHTFWSIEPNLQRDYYRSCYLADLKVSKPAVFVDAVGEGTFGYTDRANAAHEIFPELTTYLRSNYVLAADLGEARVYARRGLVTIGAFTSSRLAQLTSHPRPANLVVPPLTSLDHFQKKTIDHRNVVMLLPPAKIEWPLEADRREVVLGFGFDPFAYANGKSNGVELIVELMNGEEVRTLYRRYLDPFNKPEDRHPQKLIVTLPLFGAGTRLVLRTDPGPYGDAAWDWLYLDNLQFTRSSGFISNQFPGFDRPPDSGTTSLSILTQTAEERLLLLPDATELNYRLQGDERRLQFEYGMQSETEGDANYRVELRHPGKITTLLFEKRLQPAIQPADRGRQKAEIALKHVQSGDTLSLTINSPTNRTGTSNSPYVTGFHLE